jgi:molecular chaperone DnaK
LGGGTFDVSILEVGDEVFEVLATSGDTHLGGDDFDQAIVNYAIKSFEKAEGFDLYQDKQALQRIIEASEKAKIELSNLQSTRLHLPFICMINQVAKHIDIELDRSKFEELCKDILDRCKRPVSKALEDAKLSKADIDEIILVGGSTRVPAVRNLLINLLGKPLNETVNPDEVVAMGAAIQAGIIGGEITDLILLDVTPLSLGVETMGGLMTTVINRNASIPVKQSEIFSTGSDLQDTVDVHVLQGERPFAKDNKSLGIFRLSGIPPAPRGIPKISVTFQLDVDGLLSVSAREEKSGKEQSIQIEGASVLDRQEVSKMIKDAEENAVSDKLRKSLVDITYEFDNVLSKSDIILEDEITLKLDSEISLYFKEVLNETQTFYKGNQFTKIYEESIDDFIYIYNLLLSNYFKTKLTTK